MRSLTCECASQVIRHRAVAVQFERAQCRLGHVADGNQLRQAHARVAEIQVDELAQSVAPQRRAQIEPPFCVVRPMIFSLSLAPERPRSGGLRDRLRHDVAERLGGQPA